MKIKFKNVISNLGLSVVILMGILGNMGLVFSLTVDKNILDVVAYIQKMVLTTNGLPSGTVGVQLDGGQGSIWARNKIETPGSIEARDIDTTFLTATVVRVNPGWRIDIPVDALRDKTVTTNDLVTWAVTTDILADGSVTAQKLASWLDLGSKYWKETTGGITYTWWDVFVGNTQISASWLSQNLNSDMVDGFHATDILAMGSASSAWWEFVTFYRYPRSDTEFNDPGIVNCPVWYSEVYRWGYYLLYRKEAGGLGYVSVSSPNGGCIAGYRPAYNSSYNNDYIILGCKVCRKNTNNFPQITVFWKTRSTYKGDLGGRAWADAKCQSEIPAYLQWKITNVHAVVNVTEDDEIIDYLDADPDGDGIARAEFPVEAPIYYFDPGWSKFEQIYANWQAAISNVGRSTLNYSSLIGWAWENRRGEWYVVFLSSRNCWYWTKATDGSYLQPYYDWSRSTCDQNLPLVCMWVMPSQFIKW